MRKPPSRQAQLRHRAARCGCNLECGWNTDTEFQYRLVDRQGRILVGEGFAARLEDVEAFVETLERAQSTYD